MTERPSDRQHTNQGFYGEFFKEEIKAFVGIIFKEKSKQLYPCVREPRERMSM